MTTVYTYFKVSCSWIQYNNWKHSVSSGNQLKLNVSNLLCCVTRLEYKSTKQVGLQKKMSNINFRMRHFIEERKKSTWYYKFLDRHFVEENKFHLISQIRQQWRNRDKNRYKPLQCNMFSNVILLLCEQ